MIRKIHTGTNDKNFYLLYLCISGPCLRTMDRYEPIYAVMEIRMKIVWPHSVQSCFWLMPHGLSFLISKKSNYMISDCPKDDDVCQGAGNGKIILVL